MDNGEQTPVVEPVLPANDLCPEVLELPSHLRVELEIPGFKVHDLLALDLNALVDTCRKEGSHVPVSINGEMIAWAEIDVIEDHLAVRLTEIV
jgi:flagellar motor switch/type III secretory pathway protein FliN